MHSHSAWLKEGRVPGSPSITICTHSSLCLAPPPHTHTYLHTSCLPAPPVHAVTCLPLPWARCHMPAPPMGTLSRACPPLHPCMCRSSPPPSHTHTCTNSHTHVCACTHAHTHICMHACTHTHARTHTCAHARTHARTHTLMHAQSYAHTCTHIHARTHTRTCTRTRTSCTSTIKSPIPTIPCRCPTEWPPRSATAAHRAHAATLSHTPALPMRMPSHALTHPHMPSHALTCPHSHALTCPHMPSHTLTCPRMPSHALTCPHVPSHALTCPHLQWPPGVAQQQQYVELSLPASA